VLLKEIEKPKYGAKQIVTMMKAEGFLEFNLAHHTALWKSLDAQNPAKGFGVRILASQWYWYDNWIARVRAHCQEHAARYQ
jgi:hypothetical protein